MSLRQTRIDNMIAECGLLDNELAQWAMGKLLDWQPTAREIRLEPQCPICKRQSTVYLSYILPTFDKSENHLIQFCGYYCPRCDFSGAGRREVKP